jgi:hypothetical protein
MASSQPGVAILIELAPIIGITMAVIAMPTVPVVRAVIRSVVIPVRIIVTVRVISVITRKSESDIEVNLSIRTRRSREHQNPGHDCG